MSSPEVPPQQPIAIGIQDGTLLQMTRGYATLEAGFIQQQQALAAKDQQIADLEQQLAALKATYERLVHETATPKVAQFRDYPMSAPDAVAAG